MAKKKKKGGFKRRYSARKTGKALLKTSFVAGGAGALGQVAAETLGDSVDFVKDNWYGEPIALMLGAYLVGAKSPAAGHGLAGAAGYAAAFRFKLNEFQKGDRTETPVPTFKQEGSDTPGFSDSGAYAAPAFPYDTGLAQNLPGDTGLAIFPDAVADDDDDEEEGEEAGAYYPDRSQRKFTSDFDVTSAIQLGNFGGGVGNPWPGVGV